MSFLSKFFSVHHGEYDARVRRGNQVAVSDALKELYGTKILPLEKHYNYEEFFSTPLEPAYFESKPLVLLFGEYSTGKTSFIKYVLGKEYPGMRIGPEPTTDNFIIVEYGEEEGIIPGNALVVDKNKQYGSLAKFGGQFLNRFQSSSVKSELLEKVTLVDTPGILSGEKERGYDLTAVLRWFAERCDRIILLFDINKLDISDELRAAIDMVKGFENKIKIVLNKSDTVNTQQLMRVYGALMWSLGKVMATPEAARVYIGSFWENPWQHEENRHLFEEEEADLIVDIYTLTRDADLRKLNDLVRRAKTVRLHAYLMAELHRGMPLFGIGAERRKRKLLLDLSGICSRLSAEYQIPAGDFPDLRELQHKLRDYDFSRIKNRKKKLFNLMEEALSQDIGRLMQAVPRHGEQENAAVKERQRQFVLNKVWTERMMLRRSVRHREVSTCTASSEKLSETSGVDTSLVDHHLHHHHHQTQTRYQRFSNRTVTSLRTPLAVTSKDDVHLSHAVGAPVSGGDALTATSMAVPAAGGTTTTTTTTTAPKATTTAATAPAARREGGAGGGTLKRPAPSPNVETRTIVTRTESETSPSGDRVVRTKTTIASPDKTEVKTTETVTDGHRHAQVTEKTQVVPANARLDSYSDYQAPKIEALYATIQKKKSDSLPIAADEKKAVETSNNNGNNKSNNNDTNNKGNNNNDNNKQNTSSNHSATVKEDASKSAAADSVTLAENGEEPLQAGTTAKPSSAASDDASNRGTLKKIGETTRKKTEVKVEEKTTIIATTSVANGDLKKNRSVKETEAEATLPLNIHETSAEQNEEKVLNLSGTSTKPSSSSSTESKEQQRRKFLFGATKPPVDKSEPSIILTEMKESYDQSSIKDYDGIINDS